MFVPTEPVSKALKRRLDGGPQSDCSTGTFNTVALAPGQHTLSIRATDMIGNVATPLFTWIIDQTPPTMSVSGLPQITKSRKVTFTVSSSEPLLGGESELSGGCALDAQALWRTCQGTTTFTGLADGVHTYSVQGVDPAYNVSALLTRTFTVDGTAPIVTITLMVGRARTTSNRYQSMVVTRVRAITSGIARSPL